MQRPPPPPPPETQSVPKPKGTKKTRTDKKEATESGKVAKPGRKRRRGVVEVENAVVAGDKATIDGKTYPSMRSNLNHILQILTLYWLLVCLLCS